MQATTLIEQGRYGSGLPRAFYSVVSPTLPANVSEANRDMARPRQLARALLEINAGAAYRSRIDQGVCDDDRTR